MDELSSRQAEVFRAVMVFGSMTRAAETLGLSQPAVSRMITALTQTVGFPLFRRQNGGVVPTDDARLLLREIDKLFFGMDELKRRAEAIRTGDGGAVRIAAMSHYANDLLPAIVAGFMRRFPRIVVTLEAHPRRDISDCVTSGRSDIGITALPVRGDPDLVVSRLIARSAVCIMPANAPFASKPVIDAADLEGLSFVSFTPGTSFRYEVDQLFDRRGITRQMRVEATSQESVCNLVAAGAGVSVVSPFSAGVFHDGRLAIRPFTPALTVEIGLLAADERLSIAARCFRDFVIDHFCTAAAEPLRVA